MWTPPRKSPHFGILAQNKGSQKGATCKIDDIGLQNMIISYHFHVLRKSMEIRPRKKFLSVSFPNVPRSRMVQDGPGTLYVLYIYDIYIYDICIYIYIYL